MEEKNKTYNIFPIILIAVLGFLIYANSVEGKFIWDDRYLIKENIYIKNPADLPKLLTKNIGMGAGLKSASYRPLQMLTYAANYRLHGLDTRGYHFTNILFHILAALALYYFLSAIFNNRNLSLIAALLFVSHPIHTEAVSYISGRADPMALFFMLLAFTGPIFFYVLALFSRESALIFPFLLFLYYYAFGKKIERRRFFSVVAVSCVYVALRMFIIKTNLPSDTCDTTFFERLPGFFVAITEYFRLLLWPFELHMEYGDRIFGMAEPKALLGAAITIFLLGCAFRKRRENKVLFFSVSWFFITLLPSSNLYPINAYLAEHWMYVPSIGFFLLLANGILSSPRKRGSKLWIPAFAGMTIIFYSSLTIMQNNYWKEPIAFYNKTLEYAPDSFRVHNDLGIEYYEMGEKEKAARAYERAIELDPKPARAHNNLGVVYKNLGKIDKALGSFEKAVALDPGLAEAYNNLGVAYDEKGKKEKAIEAYKKAIELDPNPAEAYSNLGNIYSSRRQYKEAIRCYEKALTANPHYGNTYNNLANAYKDTGNYNKAIELYKKALELGARPLSAVHGNLAHAYLLNNQHDLAREHYDKARHAKEK